MDIKNNISLSQILDASRSELSATSQIKLDEKGALYSDSNKPIGYFKQGLSVAVRFFTGDAKKFRAATVIIATEIGKTLGPDAKKAFMEKFSSRFNQGSPLTAGSVRSFVAQYKMTDAYENNFKKDAVLGTTQEIKDAFTNQASSSPKTIKMISPEKASLGKMGYNTSEDWGLSDGLISGGGAVIIYGEKEKAVMTESLKDVFNSSADAAKKTLTEDATTSHDEALSEKLKSFTDIQMLGYEKANSIRWDRRTFTANGKKIDCSGSAETHTTEKNLQNFKSAIKELTGEEPSDRQTYELICLIDEENYTKGFPSGEDPAIGMAFKMTAMKFGQGKEGKEVIDIKYNPASKTFSLDCTTPPSHLSAIDIPVPGQHAPISLKFGLIGKGEDPKPLSGLNTEERKAALGDTPQFETSSQYTYTYTPDPKGEQGAVAISDSRQAYWPSAAEN